MWTDRQGGSLFVEMALILPVFLFLLLGLLNLGLMHMVRMHAALAAAEGAHAAARSFTAPATAGTAAATTTLNVLGGINGCPPAAIIGFGSPTVTGGATVGAEIQVVIPWCTVNLFGGLAGLWGGTAHTARFAGDVTALSIKEGW